MSLERTRLGAALASEERVRLEAYFAVERAEPGAEIVVMGAADRALYVVLDGEARVLREDLDLGSVHAGDHFGELGLVANRARSATVVAVTAMSLLRLDHARYLALTADAPALAVRFVECLIAGVAHHLDRVTASVGALLEDRSLPRRTSVTVLVDGAARVVPTGTRAGSLLPRHVGEDAVVAAALDNVAVSLDAPLSAPCRVDPISTRELEGRRIREKSLGLLLLEAARRVRPDLALSLDHSVGAGRLIPAGEIADRARLAEDIAAEMSRLVGEGAHLREEWWTVAEAIAHFAERGEADVAALLRTWRAPHVRLVSYGEVHALGLTPLAADVSLLDGFEVLAHDGALLLIHDRSRRERAIEAAAHVKERSSAQLRWLDTLGISDVGAFNASCVDGEVSKLIQVSEGFQEKQIGRIADELTARHDRVKLVSVAGPSSSGKTTFMKRLGIQLRVNGINPVGLSIDDYYIDRDRTPKDEDGKPDFESFEAIDHRRLGHDLARLLAGERVRTPRFDFPSGQSLPDGGPELMLREEDVLVLEGIHGLNPALTAELEAGCAFRIFIAPITQLRFDRATRVHSSDVRLLRRIVRDRRGRGWTAAQSIAQWPSVRRGERLHIFPFQGHADVVFDSSLVYEPSVLKVYAERYLLEVPRQDPAYLTAFRLLELVDPFVAIYPEHVPATSLLREFIGGGALER